MYRESKKNLHRGWDTQSPMPILKLVLICKAMEICLIFVNIIMQSKLFTPDLMFTKYEADHLCRNMFYITTIGRGGQGIPPLV